jgi:hypothetical protein
VKIAAAALVAFYALTACSGHGTAVGSASPSTTAPPPTSISTPSGSGTPSPADEPFTTRLNCGRPVTAAHGLALYALTISPPMLEILDVSNPSRPALLCLLSPAQGGRFVQATEVVFWMGDQLGSADLSSGKVVPTARLPLPAFEGAFSRDGSTFAYRATEDAAGTLGTHLDSGGYDRTLYTQEPIGGHGGPPPDSGPVDQLEFSPDGKELLDFNAFRGASGPDTFLVYRTVGILGTYAPPDGFRIFQSSSTVRGAWSPTGSTLYFFVPGTGFTGEVDSLEATGRRVTLASSVNGFFWPRVTPAGPDIVYDSYVSPPGDSCGGMPHLWRFSFTRRAASELSPVISSEPVFVTPTVVWSNEEKPAQCGPGGESLPDGVIIAHDMGTGRDARVDMTATIPGIGGPPSPPANTASVLDAWF